MNDVKQHVCTGTIHDMMPLTSRVDFIYRAKSRDICMYRIMGMAHSDPVICSLDGRVSKHVDRDMYDIAYDYCVAVMDAHALVDRTIKPLERRVATDVQTYLMWEWTVPPCPILLNLMSSGKDTDRMNIVNILRECMVNIVGSSQFGRAMAHCANGVESEVKVRERVSSVVRLYTRACEKNYPISAQARLFDCNCVIHLRTKTI